MGGREPCYDSALMDDIFAVNKTVKCSLWLCMGEGGSETKSLDLPGRRSLKHFPESWKMEEVYGTKSNTGNLKHSLRKMSWSLNISCVWKTTMARHTRIQLLFLFRVASPERNGTPINCRSDRFHPMFVFLLAIWKSGCHNFQTISLSGTATAFPSLVSKSCFCRTPEIYWAGQNEHCSLPPMHGEMLLFEARTIYVSITFTEQFLLYNLNS